MDDEYLKKEFEKICSELKEINGMDTEEILMWETVFPILSNVYRDELVANLKDQYKIKKKF
jgi:hypothetical protein